MVFKLDLVSPARWATALKRRIYLFQLRLRSCTESSFLKLAEEGKKDRCLILEGLEGSASELLISRSLINGSRTAGKFSQSCNQAFLILQRLAKMNHDYNNFGV